MGLPLNRGHFLLSNIQFEDFNNSVNIKIKVCHLIQVVQGFLVGKFVMFALVPLIPDGMTDARQVNLTARLAEWVKE